jgi:nucleotide-binding universal stress UspA family protein
MRIAVVAPRSSSSSCRCALAFRAAGVFVLFDRILVATDFSPVASPAIARARALAARGGTLVLLHVVDASLLAVGRVANDGGVVLRLRERLAAAASQKLEDLAREARLESPLELRVDFGRPAEGIVSASERERADAIVVGAHARWAIGRLVLGSVAEEVARTSPVPVLVVRERATGTPAVERVLVAIDLAARGASIEVLRAADDLARRLGAKLEAVTVVEPTFIVGPAMGLAGAVDVMTLEDLVADARRELPAFVTSTLSRAEIPTTVLLGTPAREVARAATPRDAIVCGTHGRSLLGRLAFGSVATGILRRAPCPVLVVRPRTEAGPAASKGSDAR